jgi:hypothetical protein
MREFTLAVRLSGVSTDRLLGLTEKYAISPCP